MKIPIVVPDWNPTDFNPIAGETSENAYVASDFFDRESTDAKTVKFVAAYEKKWNEKADFYSANYYDAVSHILPELMKRVAKKGGNPLGWRPARKGDLDESDVRNRIRRKHEVESGWNGK